MNLTLKIWRQADAKAQGKMETFKVTEISEHMSFLEMLDVLNEQLINEGQRSCSLRSRLPRGDLWRVFALHQRRASWSRPGDYNLVNCTCAPLRMATPSLLSHGEQRLFR